MKAPEKIVSHIVEWLKDYQRKSKMNGFVVGVSGGIDSAVTSTLCSLTNAPVLCVEMEIHQDTKQVSRANEHIEWLEGKFDNVTHQNISLTAVFESFVSGLPTTHKKDEQLLSLANTRARLRMTTLYYFAALHRYLVAGTGNKVEDFGVGFYTKYGDGGVDISPIADCNKSEVWEIGKSINILQEIIDAAPTDGLWDDGRTDEGQLGLKYEELEEAMNNVNSINRQKYEKIRKMNLHKMEPIPVCKIPN